MSYIFIDADAARSCTALMREKEALLRALVSDAAGEDRARLTAFCEKLEALAADLSDVTEAYAAEDERLKAVHLMNNEGGRVHNG